MACKTSFELYHNFPKVAEESGFAFNTHRPRVHIEWNKIRIVDIESIIRERKFGLIEQHINDILDCVLESEFDVRILDEGVIKMFRLAQLSVEYQQFCRHYLDRSVYVLREEVSALAQEIDLTKGLLKEREEEIRKLRRKTKHFIRPSLPYGNDNIASMILKTLSNKSDMFPSLASADVLQLQHNKCRYCDKVFLNQLYLESHISRRHLNNMEIPQKDSDTSLLDRNRDDNLKLNNEVIELKSKLADMEKLITNFRHSDTPENKIDNKETKINDHTVSKEMKDVEVSTNDEGYILDKIEEWKKEEHEKYNKEISVLRTQIVDMINSYKEKEKQTLVKNDTNIMAELFTTIKLQGAEITALKLQLANSKSDVNTEETERRKEIEEQITYWVNRAEVQSNEYKTLLQKLKEVSEEAQKSRALADMERERVSELQVLLQQQNENLRNNAYTRNSHTIRQLNEKTSNVKEPDPVKSCSKTNSLGDKSLSLEKLQRKAQELLNMERVSTSEVSSTSDENLAKIEKIKPVYNKKKTEKPQSNAPQLLNHSKKIKPKSGVSNLTINAHESEERKNMKLGNKEKLRLKENILVKKENGSVIHPGSPVKIIRAKITEEVNNRLAKLGVDPLKSRLPQNIFQKQRMQIQEYQELKFKKYPSREQVLHSLLAHLDLKTIKANQEAAKAETYTSPSKITKPFSFSSVISNVKTKALSLVKTNDFNKNAHKTYDDVAKKAMFLLKTPPSSTQSSPKILEKETSPKMKSKETILKDHTNVKNKELVESSDISSQEYYNKNLAQTSTSTKNIVKSPTRSFSHNSIPSDSIKAIKKNSIVDNTSDKLHDEWRTGSTNENKENSSDDVESLIDQSPRRAYSEENILKRTKGVLKHASSTSSLNKKKVIFDMDAIQMKSVSASSPSQSITEKSDTNEKYGLGVVNFDNEEWDISSIENEPVQQQSQNKVITRASPKIETLKQAIESQLARRNNTQTTALAGGVDVLTGGFMKNSTVGGSNTSLGSSILDDTDSTPVQNQVAFIKSKFVEKEDSEIDISEFITDEIKSTIKTK